MVGEMDCAVTSVDFDRMLNGLDRIYSEFARAFGALEPWEQCEIMRLIGKFSHALGDECDAFKQHIAAESQAENQGEGESCDS